MNIRTQPRAENEPVVDGRQAMTGRSSLFARGLALGTDRRFLLALGVSYAVLTFAVAGAIDPFWRNNWDVQIFAGAGKSFFDGGSLFDLYAHSRAQFYWPFPYPPLYAMVLAPFVWLHQLLPVLPEDLLVRVPVVIADTSMAALIYALLRKLDRPAARIGALVWLLNPVLFYQTAVQAHQESVWLLPVVAAYAWVSRWGRDRVWVPSLLLTLAVSLKQSAVLYLIPFGVYLLLGDGRWRKVLTLTGLFVLVFGGLALPFYLYSHDFWQMVFVEVPNMPVQTQSWVVWLLTLTGYLKSQTESTFFLLRYQAPITLALVGCFSLVAVRRGLGWFESGLIITLLFFLTSKKVMAYHYPMVLPFLLLTYIPRRRWTVLTISLLWISWIVVSPYYAPWARPEHLPLYAVLGTLNSLFFLWLAADTFMEGRLSIWRGLDGGSGAQLASLAILLTGGLVAASLLHPFSQWPVAPGQRGTLVGGLLLATLLLTLLFHRIAWRSLRTRVAPASEFGGGGWRPVAVAVFFSPLFFTWFTMTKEVTKLIERGPGVWGL